MKKDKKLNLSEEHLEMIKYRSGYRISESARYRPLVSDADVYDNVPVLAAEATDQEDAPKPEGSVPPEPSNREPVGIDDAPVPAYDETEGDVGELPDEAMPDAPDAPPVEEPEAEVDEIQNEIIKHNIEAMKSIHSQLEDLNNSVKGLNAKLGELDADVEEVREPTNTEKLMAKKDVSYPYYFNLNDFWDGNWFNEQREKANEKGIKELPDGTFIADFDDLPEKSKIDVQSSFNELM